jgi:hypothetical protein
LAPPPPDEVGDITLYADAGAFRTAILSGWDEPVTFDVALEDFPVAPEAGSATLRLFGDTLDAPASAAAVVEKRSTPPSILSFDADGYTAIRGQRVTLTWTLSEAADVELVAVGDVAKVLLTLKAAKEGRATVAPAHRENDYALRLLRGGETLETRRLRIHGVDATGFHVYEINTMATRPPTGVLGLHAFDGRLYALMRVGDDRAELWRTAHGFEPEAWEPERDGLGEPVALSVDAARRPGVIFDGKLWLLGGDCCDPDRPGAGVGFYDFQATTWREVGPNDPRRWPETMRARMGHAALPAPYGGGIWVMGGWSQDGGLCDDVWRFDGNGWKRLDLSCGACLFGATTTTTSPDPAAWRFGGFLEPGGRPAPTLLEVYGRNGVAAPGVSLENDLAYCFGALFAPEPGQRLPYGICTLYGAGTKKDDENTGFKHRIFDVRKGQRYSIDWHDVGDGSDIGVLIGRDYAHVQTATFSGATFLRVLLPDRDWPAPGAPEARQINYLVRVDRTRGQGSAS